MSRTTLQQVNPKIIGLIIGYITARHNSLYNIAKKLRIKLKKVLKDDFQDILLIF